MEQNNGFMDRLKELLPLISIGVVVISFLNLTFYYSQFGVAIQNYIEVSEIIFSLTTFTSTIYLIAYLVLFILTAYRKKDTPGLSGDKKILEFLEKYKESNKKIVRLLVRPITEKTLYIMILLISIGLLLFRLQSSTRNAELENSASSFDLDCLALIFLTSCLLATVSLYKRQMEEFSDQQVYIFFLSIIVLSFTFLGYRNQRKADLVKLGKPKFSVTLKTDSNKIYKTSDSLLYIGATKGYYFLYNTSDKTTVIIPANTLVEHQVIQIRSGL